MEMHATEQQSIRKKENLLPQNYAALETAETFLGLKQNQKPVRLSEIKRNWNGDEEEERPLLSRLALHAYKITFTHPTTNQEVTFVAPYPKDMDATRKQLEKIYNVNPLEM